RSQYVTLKLSASTPGRSLMLARLALAGGQDEQPWLVKSSTTVRRFSAAAGCARLASASAPNAASVPMKPDGAAAIVMLVPQMAASSRLSGKSARRYRDHAFVIAAALGGSSSAAADAL